MNESLIKQRLINIVEKHKKSMPWFVLDELLSVIKDCGANYINTLSSHDPNTTQAERIVEKVCQAAKISIPEFKSRTRRQDVIDARRVAIHHIYPSLMSCRQTALFLGVMKRANVTHHKKKYADLYSTNPMFKALADRSHYLINEKEESTS